MHPEGLTEVQERLCIQLYDVGAIKFGKFKLKLHDTHPEAPLSPVYIDLRVLRRFPATPLVSSLSDRLKVGMITPRTDVKAHGSGAKVDGLLDKDRGKTVVLIDDLVTRADSKLEAAGILTEHGLRVKDIVVLIDREQGGEKQLAAKGFKLHSAFTMNKMLEFYVRARKIDQATYEDVMSRLKELNRFLGRS